MARPHCHHRLLGSDLGPQAKALSWNCFPPTPSGLPGDPHSHRHVPWAAWRQDRLALPILHSLGLGELSFRFPCDSWRQRQHRRGCHRKSPTPQGWRGPLLPLEQSPHFTLACQEPGPHSEQASCCWLETTAPSICDPRPAGPWPGAQTALGSQCPGPDATAGPHMASRGLSFFG